MNRILDITKLTQITKTSFYGFLKFTTDYVARVVGDGGTVNSKNAVNDLYKNLPEQDNLVLAISPLFGSTKRTSTIWSYFAKLYDMFYGQIEVTGIDLVDGWDFTVGWATANASVNDSDTFTTTASGGVRRNDIVEVGKFYKCRIAGTTAATNLRVFDYNVTTGLLLVTGTFDETFYFKASAAGFYVRNTDAGQSDITTLELHEVTSIPNDASQTTESIQPYVAGNIAPNENEGLKNVNGDVKYMEHDEISFGTADAWTATTVLRWDGSNNDDCRHFGTIASSNSFALKISGDNAISITFGGSTANFPVSTSFIIGKESIMHFISDGAGNFKIYIDGVSVYDGTPSIAPEMIFSSIFNGRDTGRMFEGKWDGYLIWNKALTPTQVTEVYDILSPYYPEIPSVDIGTQTWATSNFEAVATPMGTVIPEMQEGSNVEQISDDGTFESYADTAAMVADITMANDDEVATWALNTTDPISETQDGRLVVSTAGTSTIRPYILFNTATIDISKWHKTTFDYKVNSGTVKVKFFAGEFYGHATLTGSGQYILYHKVASEIGVGRIYIEGNNTFDIQIDNVSIEEVGWASSQGLYDGLIAQGESVYDATKAAAMWCYYNNDMPTGAIYGKLYNWYAVKLLEADIATYNASNPDWGWHTPSIAEYFTLRNTLGNESVAGGKMKVTGTDYWASPNTGGVNSSGFTWLGGGYRDYNGAFIGLNNTGRQWTNGTSALYAEFDDTNLYSVYEGSNKERGYSLRLIKD